MEIKIAKVRVGQCWNGVTMETKFNLEFKAENSRYFHGYSTETFETEKEAKAAMADHISGKRIYQVAWYHKDKKHFICLCANSF